MTHLLDARRALNAMLAAQRQNKRLVRMEFPRDDGPQDAMLVASRLEAHEGVSRDFQFHLEVLSDNPRIALKDVLGRMVTASQAREDGSVRYFNGYVFDFRFLRNDAGIAAYDMVLLPWLAFLRYRKDNYIFHGKTVQAQTELVFADYAVADWAVRHLTADPVMTDAVQFDESDYNYLHRRWEALGWHYWYEHREDGHTLMLSGDSVQCEPIDGQPQIPWQGPHGVKEDGLWSFSPIRTVAATLYSARSFDFKAPRPVAADAPTLNEQGKIPPLEVYEYAGAYGFKNSAAGRDFVRLRMEEIEAAGKHFEGSGDHDCVQPGRWFTLEGEGDPFDPFDAVDDDNDFLILEAKHSTSNNYETGGVAEYRNRIVCIRKKIPWRPGRGFNSTEPRIYGAQTAIVVGPPGEEIFTDPYGRVRVQFHWDRVGEYDHRSSAWVRVASTWAGSNFGFMAVPRIGQEVIVQWLDGNPDRPLITGRVYNERNMPPWELPANQTQTGILTRSSQGGGYDNANAIRFEDKKGQEELWLHAERDQRIEVEHDESHWVGRDRSKTVDRDETTHVKRHRTERVDHEEKISIGDNRTEDVGKNESITIGGNRSKTVAKNETDKIGKSWSINVGRFKTETIGMAYMQNVGLGRMENVGAGYSLNVGGMMATVVGLSQTTAVGNTIDITAGSRLTITVGASSLTMNADGRIEIHGQEVLIRGDRKVEVHGDDVDTNPA